jgi:superoxide dismutase
MAFELKDLPYAHAALAPHISVETMHYAKTLLQEY